MTRLQSSKRYVNGESPKLPNSQLLSPPPETIPTLAETLNAETQTEDNLKAEKSERSSTSPSNVLSFSELATEVEILTAKCEELEAAKDAAFDDVGLFWVVC